MTENYTLYRSSKPKDGKIKVYRIFYDGPNFKTPDLDGITLTRKDIESQIYFYSDEKFRIPPISERIINFMPEVPADITSFKDADYQNYHINNDGTPLTKDGMEKRENAVKKREKAIQEKQNSTKVLYWQNQQAIQQNNEEMKKLTESINDSNEQFDRFWYGDNTAKTMKYTDETVRDMKEDDVKAVANEYMRRKLGWA